MQCHLQHVAGHRAFIEHLLCAGPGEEIMSTAPFRWLYQPILQMRLLRLSEDHSAIGGRISRAL